MYLGGLNPSELEFHHDFARSLFVVELRSIKDDRNVKTGFIQILSPRCYSCAVGRKLKLCLLIALYGTFNRCEFQPNRLTSLHFQHPLLTPVLFFWPWTGPKIFNKHSISVESTLLSMNFAMILRESSSLSSYGRINDLIADGDVFNFISLSVNCM